MFGAQMFNPAVMSFMKQAGQEFAQCAQAESQGRMDKALAKYCHNTRPNGPADPYFAQRCQLYAAKAFAAAHLEGNVTWGQIGQLLEQSPAWPPAGDLNTQGWLFLAYMLGFLYGSELPQEKHQAIEGILPMASRVAAAPDQFARKMGMDPDELRQKAASAGGLDGLMNKLKGQ